MTNFTNVDDQGAACPSEVVGEDDVTATMMTEAGTRAVLTKLGAQGIIR